MVRVPCRRDVAVLSALALALGGCPTLYGQKVSALVVDQQVDCITPVGGGDAVAILTLEQPDDLYLFETTTLEGDASFAQPAVRVDREVTFTCPEGFDRVFVRTITVLSKRVEGETLAPPSSAPP